MPNMSVSDALWEIRDNLGILKWVSCNGSQPDDSLWDLDPQKMHKELYLPLEMGEELKRIVNEWVYIRGYIEKSVAQMPEFAFEPDIHTNLLHIMSIDDQAQETITDLRTRTSTYSPIFYLLGQIDDTNAEHKEGIKDLEVIIENIKSDHEDIVKELECKVTEWEEECEKLEKENEKLETRVEKLESENSEMDIRIDELQSN